MLILTGALQFIRASGAHNKLQVKLGSFEPTRSGAKADGPSTWIHSGAESLLLGTMRDLPICRKNPLCLPILRWDFGYNEQQDSIWSPTRTDEYMRESLKDLHRAQVLSVVMCCTKAACTSEMDVRNVRKLVRKIRIALLLSPVSQSV